MKRLLLFLTLVAASAAAQKLPESVTPYVSFSVADVRGMGYINPDLTYSVGVDYETLRWYATSQLSASTGDKLENHSGTTLGAQAFAYRRFVDSHNEIAFLAGLGVSGGRMFTTQWAKSSTKPYLSAGVELPVSAGILRLLVDAKFPGMDRLNGVTSLGFAADIPIAKHLSITGGESVESYYPTGAPQLGRRAGFVANIGLKLHR